MPDTDRRADWARLLREVSDRLITEIEDGHLLPHSVEKFGEHAGIRVTLLDEGETVMSFGISEENPSGFKVIDNKKYYVVGGTK